MKITLRALLKKTRPALARPLLYLAALALIFLPATNVSAQNYNAVDMARLIDIAMNNDPNNGLNWNEQLSNPASWNRVTWQLDGSEYRVTKVDESLSTFDLAGDISWVGYG